MRARADAAAAIALAVACYALPASAVIIDSGDGSGNVQAPADDPGWDHVGVIGGLSAVYLANGWVITANHVGFGTPRFEGIFYDPVPGSKVQFETHPGMLSDLIVFKLREKPPLPDLVISSTPPLIGTEIIMIGNGRNRGAPITWNGIDGYQWAAGKAMRWGTNLVSGIDVEATISGTTTIGFWSDFTTPPPPVQVTDHECVFTNGDSGGGTFWKNGAFWELAGVNFARSAFGGQPAETSLFGNQSFSIQLADYRADILAVVTQPDCNDGLDEDGDGLVDWPDDPGCDDANDTSERSDALPCDNGDDDDLDGDIDFPQDAGCANPAWPVEDPQCQDGDDNDQDGFVDWDGGGVGDPDPQCVNQPWRNLEAQSGCGLGFEVAPLVLLWAALRRRRRV